MRIVFMGTPDFAVPSLTALAAKHEVVQVVTRPDAIRGRGKIAEPSAVKIAAHDLGLPVIETARMTSDSIEKIIACAPDILVVVAFGCIIPDELLSSVPLGGINVHASLLPRLRGAAPIQRAILAGDTLTGVSIMRVVHELDAGAWCRQSSCEIGTKTTAQLTFELAHLGAHELSCALNDIAAGTVCWHEQDAEQATFAAKITKQEMKLDPHDSARQNVLRVQASSDTAPARARIAGRGVRVLLAREAKEAEPEASVVEIQKGHLYLGCSDGALEVLELRPDGKRAMDASAFAAGLHESAYTWERL